jgi:hypothetical protein
VKKGGRQGQPNEPARRRFPSQPHRCYFFRVFPFFFLLKERKENRTTPLSEMREQPKFQPEFINQL